MNYEFKTKPFPHQLDSFNKTKDLSSWALFWEQGTGKSKPTIDTAAYLYEKGEIDGMLIVAPNGVHLNWVVDELTTHLPDRVYKKSNIVSYNGSKVGTKSYQGVLTAFLNSTKFCILAVSYDSFVTAKGKPYFKKFLLQKRCMYVLDEAHFIKTPKAKRTITINASAKYAPYKRLLTGTPVANSPFDLYTQVRWLHQDFWRDRNLGTPEAFRQHFGVYFTRQQAIKEWGHDPGYDQLIEYKNLNELARYLKDIGSRVTKKSAGLNLPPKVFSKRYFEMTSIQKRAYIELEKDHETELDSGSVIEAELAIVRLIRFQQITAGYVGVDSEEPVERLEGANPRLNCLKDCLTELADHKVIIWARFTPDIDQIMEYLGDKAVRYDGLVDSDQRAKNSAVFKDPESGIKYMVAKPQSGATGLTWTVAKTVVYYTNSFVLNHRLQSEDRAHRIGQEDTVNYIDLICPNTVDEKIVDSLRNKFDISNQITGDGLIEWI